MLIKSNGTNEAKKALAGMKDVLETFYQPDGEGRIYCVKTSSGYYSVFQDGTIEKEIVSNE